MRGVTLNEMQSLCQYMYVGSVEVQENNLNSLLKVARELQIKGVLWRLSIVSNFLIVELLWS